MQNVYLIRAKLSNSNPIYKKVISLFGRSSSGDILREFAVQGDMPLWALHYALTRAFGFLNEHLHLFRLFDEDYLSLTKGLGKGYRDNIGPLFKCPWPDEEEDFWPDDYVRGSFHNWRKKKYTGPYVYKGFRPDPMSYRADFEDFMKTVGEEYAVMHNPKYAFSAVKALRYAKEEGEGGYDVVPFDELHYEQYRFLFEGSVSSLRETLTLDEIYSRFHRLVYEYDFGDGWEFELLLSADVPEDIEMMVRKRRAPVMVRYDGLNLVEDVGGVGGFCDFLYTLFNMREVWDFEEGAVEFQDGFYKPICPVDGFRPSGDLSPRYLLRWAKGLEWDEMLPLLDKWF